MLYSSSYQVRENNFYEIKRTLFSARDYHVSPPWPRPYFNPTNLKPGAGKDDAGVTGLMYPRLTYPPLFSIPWHLKTISPGKLCFCKKIRPNFLHFVKKYSSSPKILVYSTFKIMMTLCTMWSMYAYRHILFKLGKDFCEKLCA